MGGIPIQETRPVPEFVSQLEFLETLREKLGVLNAFIYVRQSWEEEGSISPDIQDDHCQAFADKHGINVVEVIRDIDLSGGTFDKRQVSRVISRVGDGEANIVLVLVRNRWGRSSQNDAFEAELNKAGGTLIAVTNPLDPTSSQGRTGIEVDNFVSVMTRRNISEAWRSTHQKRRNDGVPHAGGIRFGYEGCPDCVKEEFVTTSGRKRKRFVKCAECRLRKKPRPQTPNETLRPLVEEFVERWVRGGEKPKTLAREMHERGVRSARGNAMNATQWFQALDTGFAFGYLRRRKVPLGTKGMPKLYRGNGIESFDVWVRGEHKPLVEDPALWEEYKQKRGLSAGTQAPHDGSAKYPLVGFLKCGHPVEMDGRQVINEEGQSVLCGRPMHGKWVTNTKTAVVGGERVKVKEQVWIYFCSGTNVHPKQCKGVNITMTRADALTLEWLTERARGEGALPAEVELLTRARRKKALAKEKAEEVESLRKQLVQLTADRSAKLVSDLAYSLTAPDLEARLTAADKMREQYEAESRFEEAPAPTVFLSIAQMWQEASDEEKRMLLTPVLGQVIAHKTPGRRPTRLEFVPRWRVSAVAA